jgi:hypothetical protein
MLRFIDGCWGIINIIIFFVVVGGVFIVQNLFTLREFPLIIILLHITPPH